MTNNITQFEVVETQDNSDLLWLSGFIVGLAMVVFLAFSFCTYHRKVLRRQQTALDYASLNLNVKRPRIAGFLCATNNTSFPELSSSLNIPGRQNIECKAFVCGEANVSLQCEDDVVLNDISNRKCKDVNAIDANVCVRNCSENNAFDNKNSNGVDEVLNNSPNKNHSDDTERQRRQNNELNLNMQNSSDIVSDASRAGYPNKGYVADHDEIELQQLSTCPNCGHTMAAGDHLNIWVSPDSIPRRTYPLQGEEHTIRDAFHNPTPYKERPKRQRAQETKREFVLLLTYYICGYNPTTKSY